jgi:anti-sigma regulatory factor (Ser/Thr protein kinase)
VGRWELASRAELTAHRMQLSATLSDDARPAGADDGAVERLLLAFEELASNAFRHGRPPVRVAVTTTGNSWLLEVSDAAVDRPPTPAVGRDAALGGLGLYLVARICATHGWDVDGLRKVAWCRINYTGAEAPPEGSPSVPESRSADGSR